MINVLKLGHVELREVWPREAGDLSPWLKDMEVVSAC